MLTVVLLFLFKGTIVYIYIDRLTFIAVLFLIFNFITGCTLTAHSNALSF